MNFLEILEDKDPKNNWLKAVVGLTTGYAAWRLMLGIFYDMPGILNNGIINAVAAFFMFCFGVLLLMGSLAFIAAMWQTKKTVKPVEAEKMAENPVTEKPKEERYF